MNGKFSETSNLILVQVMFKIDKFEAQDSSFFIEIHCQFIQSEILVQSKLCTSKLDAMRYFNYIATEFLQGQIGEFTKIIDLIKPFYFEKTSVPFLIYEKDWRHSYYPFKHDLLHILARCTFEPDTYAQTVLRNEYLFRKLIPSLVELGKVEMAFICEDIMKCAKEIVDVLNKMRAHNYRNALKQTA